MAQPDNSTTKSSGIEQHEYRAEMKQLLHLIVHSLYTHREIFLRELISNASDALNKARFRMLTDRDVLTPDAPLKIDIRVDEEANTLEVEDTGIGMTHDDLVERIGTVASSGTLSFLEEIKESGKPLDAQLIGQFGVGFYAAFMVADEIQIATRHADKDSQGYLWRSRGEGSYTIEKFDREIRGTRITLHLKDDAKEFARSDRIQQIIKRYSNFVDFPINVGAEQVNTVKALWHRPKDDLEEEELEEFYKFVSGDYQEPLGHLHLHLEGAVNVRALLFVPSTAPPALFREDEELGLHLYSSKVFIQDDCTSLLPDYLRFVRGVVDTQDLPLNVSRETTQSSPAMARIRRILTGKVLGMLEDWSKTERDRYETFFRQFGPLFKTGLGSDFKNRDRLVELLRFESTRTEEGSLISLSDYVARMPDDQDAIYYLLSTHRDAAKRNPHLEYFQKHELDVLLLTDPVDAFTIPNIEDYEGKPLKSIEKADLELEEKDEKSDQLLEKDDLENLLDRFRKTLGDRVENVVASRRLVDSAAALAVGEQGMEAQMERLMKMMDQQFSGSKKILEVNPTHPLIANLSRMLREEGRDDVIDRAIVQLFEGALLIEGSLDDPASFFERMTDLMERATR